MALSAALLIVGAAQPTWAADTASSAERAGRLEEVVVTARFTTEDLQKSPLAITSLSGEQLEERGFSNILDVAQNAPNVTLQTSTPNGGKSGTAIIRGIGQTDFNFAEAPGVGFYVNDVYYGTMYGNIFDLMDIARVEILRGPQGTLFGANSEGGAVRLFTRKPEGTNTGYLQAGYGSYHHEELRGAFDMSLIPNRLFLRVSGAASRQDGYFTLLDYNCVHPGTGPNVVSPAHISGCKTGEEGGDNVLSLRAALRWMPTKNIEDNFVVDLTDDQGQNTPDKLIELIPSPPLNGYNAGVIVPKVGVPIDARYVTNSPYTSYTTFNDPINGQSYPKDAPTYSYGVSNTLDWDLPWGVHLKSITAYRAYDGHFSFATGSSPTPISMNYNTLYHNQVTQELDVTGTTDWLLGRQLDWTVGGFYYDGFSKNGGNIDLGIFGTDFDINDPATDTNKSVFLHAIYHITDRLSFEGGYRYTTGERTYTFYRFAHELGHMPVSQYLFPLTTGRTSYDRSDWKAGIQYQWTPDLMTYFDVSTGFKAGGINPRPISAAQVIPFGPESVTAYEAGVKSQWFDNRLRFNTDVFYSDYKDLQLEAIGADLNGNLVDVIRNVGHAAIEGWEAELAATPLPGLMINGDVGYLHYRTMNLGAAAGVAGGPTLTSVPVNTPTWKWSVGVQYDIEMDRYGSLMPRLDYTYQTLTYNDLPNTPAAATPGYGMLNGRLTWAPAEGDWSLALEVKNALDKVYYVNKLPSLGSFGTIEGQPGQPRTYFVTIRRDF